MNVIMHNKNIVLCAIVMTMMLLPIAMSGQGLFGNDNYFKIDENNYNNRDIYINDNVNPGITNQTFGQELPLGSGIAVIVAAGAGYAIMKRRKNNAKN